MDITSQDFPEIRWNGNWIWVGEAPIQPGSPFHWDNAPRPEAHGMFRKSFNIANVPSRAPMRLSADSRYMLWVNGEFVGFGPARSQPRRMRYDTYDLAPYLCEGENSIAILVKYNGTPRTDWAPAVANGMLGKSGILVFEADIGGEWLLSDESWRTRLGRGWSEDARHPNAPDILRGVAVESFDAREEESDWNTAGFDDSEWLAAQVVTPIHIGGRGRSTPPTDPYGAMLERGIAHLDGEMLAPASVDYATSEATPSLTSPAPAVRTEGAARAIKDWTSASLPLCVDANSGHSVVRLDMGKITAGFVEFTVSAPKGTVFEFYYAEQHVTRPPEFGAAGGNRYIARGESDTHRVFDKKGFRFAYVLIHSARSEVALEDFKVREHHYPWSGDADFDCSDPEVTRLYNAGKRTVALNSWDGFLDCPTREQRAWVGDAVVHQMVHLATNSDWRLAEHYLDLGNSPRPDGILPMSVAGDVEHGEGFTIPDWSLHWIHGVWNLYRYVGNKDRVKEFMPTAERILRWYLPFLTRDGVLQDVPEWNLIDWSALYSEAQSSIVTSLWARGLKEFAEMAEWLGENASRSWAEGLYERVQSGFDRFWDEERGTYVDHCVDGVQQRPINQLAGAIAIVAGLAPKERHDRIIKTITDPSKLVVRSWMFPGATPAPGEHAERFRRMTRGGLVPDWDVENEIVIAEPFMSYVVHDAVTATGHAAMLPDLILRWNEFLGDGYDTFGENWGTGTRVHGWSSTPTRDLVFSVLGITPAEAGYSLARIAPRLGRLTSARGTAPTPHGPIRVNFKGAAVEIESPVPFDLSLKDGDETGYPAGRHSITL